MHNFGSLLGFARRAAAITFFMAGTASLVQAQQAPAVAVSRSAPLLLASEAVPSAPAAASGSLYSSSVDSSSDAVAGEQLDLSSAALDSTQPPPRRRYGRPNYADSHTNPDGSNKYTFVAGAGFTLPTGGTHNDLTTGYKFQVGGGRNFNKTFGVLVQFDYDHFGFQEATLTKLLTIYNNEIIAYNNANPGADIPQISQLGGTSHDWSFTLDPVINYYNGERAGAYVIGGVGFYHKTANFTTPQTAEECSIYGCFDYQANETVDKYTSNAFGANAGFGFTYKPSRFAGERFFAEARYVWTDNQPRPYSETGTTANPNYYNVFPQNSARTTYIPVTFGLRF
ncbi:MAG: hypothetical protein ABR910_01570 [Acidobacteriaceae bacterium]|jgi:hypothetical protein